MFSRKTILELIKALNFCTHDEVDRFAIEFGLEEAISGRYLKENETSTEYFKRNRLDRAIIQDEWISRVI
jgi:hypothetical protein